MRLLIDRLRCYAHTIKSGLIPTVFTCNQLINLFSEHGLLHEARKLFEEMPDRNVFTWNVIVSAYIKSNNLAEARLLFDAAWYRDLVTFNSLLSGYANNNGYEIQAVDLFMQYWGDETRIDEVTLTIMLKLTAKLHNSFYGKQLHSLMVKTANNLSGFAVSALVDMYSKCGCFSEAYEAFNGCSRESVDVVSKNAVLAAYCREGRLGVAWKLFSSQPELNNMVSWNTMISGYTQNKYSKVAIELSVCMAENGFKWKEHTFASVLSACSSLKALNLGKELHARILKEAMILNPFICSGLVDMYCKCGNMKYAELVHSTIGTENKFSATSMIVGYSSQNNMEKARRIFDSLSQKNQVVWSAMFSGYLKSQCSKDVFELFRVFRDNEATIPNVLVLVTLLGACALQATVDPGRQVHAYILRMGIDMDEKTLSALIDMYSKCGSIAYAQRIFERLRFRDLVVHNIMIAGFAHHGYACKAFQLLEEMTKRGFGLDSATFIAVLSACRHCGSVEVGEKYFKSMTVEYNVTPELDHYACMVDLYGRGNQLEKALELMRKIPIELDAVILGTFLNVCKLNGNVELALEVEEKLLRMEGGNGGRYVQLANVYAADGLWNEVGRLRKKMRGNAVNKVAGYSWLHVGNKVYSFTSGRISHSKAEAVLHLLLGELNGMGCCI